ncbi:uncharacterized protein FIESC28_05969 [Fusarium coffeatum]|uniref:Cyclin-like domain-containing protein n=1 Tax=Fusarium coffeatum TaxID=231269 RepID=A0A366RNA7_9HYPO|nr:uncharacterized protein FIESC28_05969 [Fusarium coffeatum]RBR18617.1 hypothetical protein FIESC28_05969 [Fusarium coffeatum]
MIDNQRDIRWHMRPYLIDFLIEFHSAYSMLSETLFLAINLLDRYCSKRQVLRQHYQLAGCVALFIASKYGDKKCNTPCAKDLNRMCRGIYEIRLFSQMELHVLDSLGWAVGHPTGELFSKIFLAEHGDDKEVECMAAYLREIALYHRSFVSTKPSVMARSSLALARTILNRNRVKEEGEDEASTSITLSQHLREPSTTLARKYSTYSLCHVSQKLAEFTSRGSVRTHRIAHISVPYIGVTNRFSNGFGDGVEDSNGAIAVDGISASSDISKNHSMQKSESFNEVSASNGCL